MYEPLFTEASPMFLMLFPDPNVIEYLVLMWILPIPPQPEVKVEVRLSWEQHHQMK